MSKITQLNHQNFEKEVLQSQKPVLVDFWASWCMPCLMMEPILEEVAGEMGDKIKIAKFNVELPEHQALAAQYGIQSIPNMKIFKEGKIVSEIIGLRPKNDVIDIIKSVIGSE